MGYMVLEFGLGGNTIGLQKTMCHTDVDTLNLDYKRN